MIPRRLHSSTLLPTDLRRAALRHSHGRHPTRAI